MITTLLRTERLLIRALALGDLDGFRAIWGDPDVIWWGHDADLETTRGRVERVVALSERLPDAIGWAAVIEEATESLVGDVFLQLAPFVSDAYEFGFHFARVGQGRGLATEAARSLIANAFARGLPRIVAAIVPTNVRSLKVAARLGMERVGEVTHANRLHDLFEITPARLVRLIRGSPRR